MIFGPHFSSFRFFSFLGARTHKPQKESSPNVTSSITFSGAGEGAVHITQQQPHQFFQIQQNSQQPPFVQVVQTQQYRPLTNSVPPANLVLIHSAQQYVNQPTQTPQQYQQDSRNIIFSPRQIKQKIKEYYAPQKSDVQYQQPQQQCNIFSTIDPRLYNQPTYVAQNVQSYPVQYIQPQQYQSPQTQYASPMRAQQSTQHQQYPILQQPYSQPNYLPQQQQYVIPTKPQQQSRRNSGYYETFQSPEKHPLQVNANPSELSNSIQALINLEPNLYATNDDLSVTQTSSQITEQQSYRQVTLKIVNQQVSTYEVPTHYREVSSVDAYQGWGEGANQVFSAINLQDDQTDYQVHQGHSPQQPQYEDKKIGLAESTFRSTNIYQYTLPNYMQNSPQRQPITNPNSQTPNPSFMYNSSIQNSPHSNQTSAFGSNSYSANQVFSTINSQTPNPSFIPALSIRVLSPTNQIVIEHSNYPVPVKLVGNWERKCREGLFSISSPSLDV